MDAFKKNSVVARLASAKHFEKDREHYMKVFPASPIIPSLKSAQSFSKRSLDERMLFELLDHVCEETIQDYRGLLPKKSEEELRRDAMIAAQKTVLNTETLSEIDLAQMKGLVADLGLDVPDEKQETLISALESYKESFSDSDEQKAKEQNRDKAAEIVMNTDDLSSIDYNDMRGLVADLDIETEDQKKDTLIDALLEYKTSLTPTPADDQSGEGDGSTAEPPEGVVSENPEADKKKEGPKPNTPA
jgi:hypothetical protein